MGGQRLATAINDELYYLLTDHLGSTTIVADANGNQVGYVLYDPYGSVLTNTLPLTLTDRLFTGQRYEESIGLYDYNYPRDVQPHCLEQICVCVQFSHKLHR